jgi:glycosyltransferase involved in cell wall biosynthesis
MKILFVVPRYHTNMTGWVKALQKEKHDVCVHAILKGSTENYENVTPKILESSSISRFIVNFLGEGGVNSPRLFPEIKSYYKLLKKIKPDYIIVRDITRCFSLEAAILGRLLGAKIVIYSQAVLYTKYSRKRQVSFNMINWVFNAVWMTPLEGNINNAKNIPKKMVFVPFAIGEIDNVALRRDFKREINIFSIGKFVLRKNHLLLLQALKEMKDEGYLFRLTIIGENSNALHEIEYIKVLDFIKRNNLQNCVNIKLNVAHNLIGDEYKKNNLFVLPASNEPAAISVLEAVGFGLPVVCSSTCGTKYYIENKNNGFIFKDKSIASLKKALLWFFDKDNMTRFTINSFELANEKISMENFINIFNQKILNAND